MHFGSTGSYLNGLMFTVSYDPNLQLAFTDAGRRKAVMVLLGTQCEIEDLLSPTELDSAGSLGHSHVGPSFSSIL